MDPIDSHYNFLGLPPTAPRSDIEACVERRRSQADAVATSDPQWSHEIRERLRRIREDLLTSDQRRRDYDQGLREFHRGASKDATLREAITSTWEPPTEQWLSRVPREVDSPPSTDDWDAAPGGVPLEYRPTLRHRPLMVLSLVVVGSLLGAGGAVTVLRGWPPWTAPKAAPGETPVPTRRHSPRPTHAVGPTFTATPSPTACTPRTGPSIQWTGVSLSPPSVAPGGSLTLTYTIANNTCSPIRVTLGATLVDSNSAAYSDPASDRTVAIFGYPAAQSPVQHRRTGDPCGGPIHTRGVRQPTPLQRCVVSADAARCQLFHRQVHFP